MKRNVAVLFALMVLMVSPASALVVTQPLVDPDADGGESTNDISQTFPGFEAAESFTVPQTAEVVRIDWWGVYDNFFGIGLPPVDGDDFTLRIFADDGGVPDSVPFAEYTGLTDPGLPTGILDVGLAEIYRYSTTAPAGLVLTGGQTYYLSVVNNIDLLQQDNSTWLWSEGTGGDTQQYEREAGSGASWGVSPFDFDLAYEIELEAQVPVPPTWLLMFVPAMALALRRR
jgi:hypothetical protein